MPLPNIRVLAPFGRSQIDWKYLKKLHLAIHVIQSINSHLETEFMTQVPGWKYTVPKKEKVISRIFRSGTVSETLLGAKYQPRATAIDPQTSSQKALLAYRQVKSW
ncbi:hypothetical protein B0H19DRAFT_1081506 [Mycena capillaripes]|nr:hypothetical protein B0H19DRAFT_1081506 [Mycena capillaripes]